jgi:hypothetical protein
MYCHATCRQAADAARQQLQRSAAAEKALEQKLRGLRTTAAGLKAESSSSANQNVVVQALLEAKRKGEIPGVYGRLGDLGSIDAKYVWCGCLWLPHMLVRVTMRTASNQHDKCDRSSGSSYNQPAAVKQMAGNPSAGAGCVFDTSHGRVLYHLPQVCCDQHCAPSYLPCAWPPLTAALLHCLKHTRDPLTCRYDVAISTACGALNYIVVETTSDAQRCVELLRRRNLGVATFLILEKQRGLAGQMNEAVQMPEGECTAWGGSCGTHLL